MMAEYDSAGNCPLCGMFIMQQWARHQKVCLGDPAFLAVVRAAMDDGAGRAVRVTAWDRLGVNKPCSGAHLRAHFGSWDKVAEALGLRPAGGWRQHFDDDEGPMTNAERGALRDRGATEDAALCLHGEIVRVVEVRPGVVHEYIRLR